MLQIGNDGRPRRLGHQVLSILAFGVLNLVWEVAQLPLYTLWTEADLPQIAYSIIHCTFGDVLIGLAVSVLAIAAIKVRPRVPLRPSTLFQISFLVFGLAYTVFSEWLNVHIRESWAYSDLMPILPLLGTGLSPLAQWIIVPTATIFITSRHPAR